MLGTAKAQLEEELRQLKMEGHRLHDQLQETHRLFKKAGNQQKSCRTQIEMLNKDLKEATNVAEAKTRECVALVDEQYCLAQELENAVEDIRDFIRRLKTKKTSKIYPDEAGSNQRTDFFQSSSKSLWASVPASGSTTTPNLKQLKMFCFFWWTVQRWSERRF